MSHSPAPAGIESTSAPARAPLVLGTLILVSGVANLNLSVANVALPSIGDAFDSSQTTLNLIAVGYSLGLAASVLYLGAVGDRHGRKLMMMLGTLLSVPACLLAAYAPTDEVLVAARIFGGFAAGMAYPTTLALITALWSGPGRTKSIALWSALGGAIASLGPLVAGWLLEHFWWGSVFLVTLPLGGHRARDGLAVRPRARQRVDRAGRQPRRHPLGPAGGRPGAVDQLRTRAGQGHPRARPGRRRARGRGSLRVAAAACREPALRPARSPSRRDLLGRGVRRHHRLRLADGRGLRQPAVPPERARLQHRRGRRGLPAHDPAHGRRRAALGRARRDPRRPDDPAARIRLPVPRLLVDAAALGGGQQLLEDRHGVRLHRGGRRAGRHSRLPLADGLGARPSGRHGLRDGGPATRPRRRDHAVHLRRAADRGLRQRLRLGDRQLLRGEQGHPGGAVRAHQVVRGSRAGRAAVPEVRRPDHRRGEVVLPAGRRLGLQRRSRRDPAGRRARLRLLPTQGGRTAAVAGLRGTGRARINEASPESASGSAPEA